MVLPFKATSPSSLQWNDELSSTSTIMPNDKMKTALGITIHIKVPKTNLVDKSAGNLSNHRLKCSDFKHSAVPTQTSYLARDKQALFQFRIQFPHLPLRWNFPR